MDTPLPSKELRNAILSGLRQEERRRARVYLSVSALVGFVSSAGLYVSVRSVIDALYQSGFFTYFSLMFSDTGVVFAHSREFAFSLAETAPFFSVMGFFAALAFLLISLRTATLHARVALPMFFSHA